MGETEILDAIKEVKDDIKTYRNEARQDNKEIWSEINYLKKCKAESDLTAEKRNGRLHVLEQNSKRTEKRNEKIEEHLGNDIIHFNKAKATETAGSYIARKKLYYALMGLITVFLTLLTAWLQSQI
jgi:hypothetical protein